jgi:hypothetical protein
LKSALTSSPSDLFQDRGHQASSLLFLSHRVTQHNSNSVSKEELSGHIENCNRSQGGSCIDNRCHPYSTMASPTPAPSCPPSPSKRPRDSPFDDQIESSTDLLRRSKIVRVDNDQREGSSTGIVNTLAVVRDLQPAEHNQHNGLDVQISLRRLLQQWYTDFIQPDKTDLPPVEHIDALAMLIQAQPQLITQHIDQKCKGSNAVEDTKNPKSQYQTSPPPETSPDPTYSLAKANHHLDSLTLALIEKYISTCRRRRSPNDGRRSVNTGPYHCTFSCGYRTKRTFDWRRHEETHEPQELWLCSVCSISTPFLVNRKDKFLKHVADKHGARDVEQVLEKSKVAFVPRAKLGCRICGERSASWDERCRHVLGHYEEEVEREVRRGKAGQGEDRSTSVSVKGGSDI